MKAKRWNLRFNFLILLIWPVAMLAQPDPPVIPSTNYFSWSVYQVCFGGETSNYVASQTNIMNVSTNGFPWGNPYNNYYYVTWNCCQDCPDQRFAFIPSWTWGHQKFSTNYIVTTNLIVFAPYYVPGTNEIVHYESYHTDGNTLSFSKKLTGPWTWSGSPNYRQPIYFITDPIARGVSTDGSVNPVHLWLTNETWENGVLIGKEVVH